MNRRTVLSTLSFLTAGCLIFACASSGLFTTWANNFRSPNARFHRIAIFTDFTSVRPGESGVMIPVDESLDLGRTTSEQIAIELGALDYDIASSDKLFIGSYAVEKMAVAENRHSDSAVLEPPFHIDPDVTHKSSFENAVLQAFRQFAGMAAGGSDKIRDGALDPAVARALSAAYNVDAVVLAIGICRKIPGEPDTDGELNTSRLLQLRMSMLSIGIFHGYDGRLLWYGQRTFTTGQLGSVFKGIPKQLLTGFPKKGEGPYFPAPK